MGMLFGNKSQTQSSSGGGGGLGSGLARQVVTLLHDGQSTVTSAPVSKAVPQIRDATGQVIGTSISATDTIGPVQATKGNRRVRGRMVPLLTDTGGSFEQLGD